jgi:hypothetical protein
MILAVARMPLIALALTVALLQVMPVAGGSTIRGRVLDADGQPMADVEMRAMLITTEREAVVGSATSDAEGRFSMAKVPAGRIILRAQPRPPRRVTADMNVKKLLAHPPAYFPGVLALTDAWPIDVNSDEIIELDFHMPAILVGSIKARVTGPDGYVLDQVRVMRPEGNQIKNVKVDADGIGYAEDLREGRHVVVARGRSGNDLLVAQQIVQISAGEHPVDLALRPAGKITGRVVADRGGVPPIDGLRVAASWTDGTIDLDPLATDQADVGPDGSFAIDGLFGRRAIRVGGVNAGWQVAAIRHGRTDITTSMVEIDHGSTVEVVITLTRR